MLQLGKSGCIYFEVLMIYEAVFDHALNIEMLIDSLRFNYEQTGQFF